MQQQLWLCMCVHWMALFCVACRDKSMLVLLQCTGFSVTALEITLASCASLLKALCVSFVRVYGSRCTRIYSSCRKQIKSKDWLLQGAGSKFVISLAVLLNSELKIPVLLLYRTQCFEQEAMV
uniref:Secreted protein n=1 Tax=Amblyomma americanum TaxID=6943 RepID=A0A0C9R4S9_AMBAM